MDCSFASRGLERTRRLRELVLQSQRGAAQLQGLAVEDLRLLGRKQLVRLGAELLAELGFGVEPLGDDRVDRRGYLRLSPLILHGLGNRLVQLLQRSVRIALVELVDRAIVAQPARDERIVAELLRGTGEQRVGLGVAAQIGLLQRFVCERFGAAERSFADIADGGEELRGFGVAAGIVAAIGFGERAGRIERSGLDPGERRRIADARRGDRDFACEFGGR